MPRAKKVEVKPKKKVVKKAEVKEVVEEPVVKVPKVKVAVKVASPVMPTFDNKKVLKILDDGRHTDTHYHCKMEGEVTMHVPRKLF